MGLSPLDVGGASTSAAIDRCEFSSGNPMTGNVVSNRKLPVARGLRRGVAPFVLRFESKMSMRTSEKYHNNIGVYVISIIFYDCF